MKISQNGNNIGLPGLPNARSDFAQELRMTVVVLKMTPTRNGSTLLLCQSGTTVTEVAQRPVIMIGEQGVSSVFVPGHSPTATETTPDGAREVPITPGDVLELVLASGEPGTRPFDSSTIGISVGTNGRPQVEINLRQGEIHLVEKASSYVDFDDEMSIRRNNRAAAQEAGAGFQSHPVAAPASDGSIPW